MSDPATDLYSFLRSKDFTSSKKEDDDAGSDGAANASGSDDAASQSPGLRSVDDVPDLSDTGAQDAPSQDAPSSESPGGPSGGASESSEEPDALNFDDPDLGEKLRHCSEQTLNEASFGVIKVDDSGTVAFFNAYESELSGVDPSVATGKNFFTELAPCSNNRLFRGRFQKGIRRGELNETFEYTYTYKMRPTLVDVRLYRDEAGNNWIMVHKR